MIKEYCDKQQFYPPAISPSGTVRPWLHRRSRFPEPDTLGEHYSQNGEGGRAAEYLCLDRDKR